ncbi:MAG: 1-deoxy-D-xylulose-5-phosphate reductoisomerase [Rikenellaceae bacterium]|nr:1-deoxy-D-xylulose-5-phosphate reductoisomerase [Rikenellaceae bacterium]
MVQHYNIALLGATGSIGMQTLDIIRRMPERFTLVAAVAQSRWQELAAVAREFGARRVVIGDARYEQQLRDALADTDVEVLVGSEAIEYVASTDDVDMVVNALVGYAGLHPTLRAIESGKRIALANKETLVVAGDIVMAAARDKGIEILPIDSEHSAIKQCLEGEKRESVRNLIITCSGGSLRDVPRERLADVTPEEALQHPQWSMGAKITIDSATLVNKGFEVIEARWLFDMSPDNIKVVIHPQAIVHSMVEFKDGAVKAQLGNADMHTPISYALLYPDRALEANTPFSMLDYPMLTFSDVDREKYPALDIAYEVLRRGGTAPCIMNAANEVAVAAFLAKRCRLTDIVATIRYALDNATFVERPTIEDYDRVDAEVRTLAESYIGQLNY